MYIDADCIIIITNRVFIFVIIEIKKIIVSILIRNLKSKIHHFDKYIVFIFYMKNVLSNNKNTHIFV